MNVLSLTVNHPDKDVQREVTNWIYQEGVSGNEEHLVNETL